MTRQPSGCHKGGQLCNPAEVSDVQLEERLAWLCSEVLKVNNLQATVPYPSMKNATMEELRQYKKTTKDLVVIMIRELEDMMDNYAEEELDQDEANSICRMGGGVIREAYEWFDELDQAYSVMRVREIQILDGIRTAVDPFTGTDTRCIYEFLKQITPLLDLVEKDAVEVFTQELLSRQLQCVVPRTITTLRELCLFLMRGLET